MEKIFIGQTGSGKTFESIILAKKLGSFCYIAPCRQLVYETALKYGDKTSSISTGEYKRGKISLSNFYVYESLRLDCIKNFDTIIIDEAHFITDVDRGEHLLEIISVAQKLHKNIFLCTATANFNLDDFTSFKVIELNSKVNFKKIEIDEDDFWDRATDGVPSIIFCKYKDDAEEYEYHITADTPALERLETQEKFANGEIKLLACTNVLAQGLNFPCENILIEYNQWDSPEIIHQKLGRLGRYNITNPNNELTYCLSEIDGDDMNISKRSIKDISFNKRELVDFSKLHYSDSGKIQSLIESFYRCVETWQEPFSYYDTKKEDFFIKNWKIIKEEDIELYNYLKKIYFKNKKQKRDIDFFFEKRLKNKIK